MIVEGEGVESEVGDGVREERWVAHVFSFLPAFD